MWFQPFFYTLDVFFYHQNVYSQYRLYVQLQKLRQDDAYYRTQIQWIENKKNALLDDKDRLEKIAREKYYMKREKEDLYIIVPE